MFGQATFTSTHAEVRLDVQVMRGKRVLADLRLEDFVVTDESTTVVPTYFGREAEPLSLVLLLDVSGSMRRFVAEMSTAVSIALRALRAGDRVAVVAYGRRSQVQLEFSGDLREVAAAVRSAALRNDTGAGTSTNEAVLAAARLLAGDSGSRRRAILVVTDNGGVNEGVPDEQVIRELGGVVLNAIVVGKGERSRGASVNPFYTSTDVFALAEATGGEVVRAGSKADGVLSGMLERIRARYALAYSLPMDAKPGVYRNVRMMVAKGDVVRVRKGYYAPAALAAPAP